MMLRRLCKMHELPWLQHLAPNLVSLLTMPSRVLAKVSKALAHARKNHYAHKEALMKKKQKAAVAKAKRLAHKEAHAKREERRKALGIKTQEEYAAHLASAALKAGEAARRAAVKAAKAGKVA